MTQPIPEEPKFVKNINYLQRILAGIAVTMFLVVWLTGFNFVIDIFKPDFVKALTILRVTIALVAFSISSILGYRQIGFIMKAILEIYGFYQTMLEINKAKKNSKKDDEA